ncbi:hypothetical protein HPB50_019198 [Hyalomma asiaticum]|uniref:Uncharacterized protein n=1 Tax=Hyalomma asiaticum TaxID=266040 RepID=A0ACB7TQ47_HYAAI|nr:hypothetical protein HPB50_019198 [Hyalomma asiaticum]
MHTSTFKETRAFPAAVIARASVRHVKRGETAAENFSHALGAKCCEALSSARPPESTAEGIR